MLTLYDFIYEYPELAFDFSKQIADQPRIYDLLSLATLPVELATDIAPTKTGGRGRARRTQCRTHSQCASCGRILRNDCFFLPASFVANNRIPTYCKECYVNQNEKSYSSRKKIVASRRDAIWQYIARVCVICGNTYHPAAMDMHHLRDKKNEIGILVTRVTFTPSPKNAERLVAEASKCVPLCSNCHRTLHAGAITLPSDLQPLKYSTWDLLDLLIEAEDEIIPSDSYTKST